MFYRVVSHGVRSGRRFLRDSLRRHRTNRRLLNRLGICRTILSFATCEKSQRGSVYKQIVQPKTNACKRSDKAGAHVTASSLSPQSCNPTCSVKDWGEARNDILIRRWWSPATPHMRTSATCNINISHDSRASLYTIMTNGNRRTNIGTRRHDA